MLNKINAERFPIARPRPGGALPSLPKPAPGRQDDGIGCIKRPLPPKPRQPQPGDIYIGGPNPKDHKQYDAKDLEQAGAKKSTPPKDAEIRAGGPFKVDEAFSLHKLLNK